MSIEEFDYVDVPAKAVTFGYQPPEGLVLLPLNFEDAESPVALVYDDVSVTIRKLLRQAGIESLRLEGKQQKIPEVAEKSAEWVGPTLFFTASLLSQNPTIISVAVNVISSYLTELFKGLPIGKHLKLDIVVPEGDGKRYRKVHYEGPVEGLKELPPILKEIWSRE